MNTLVSRHPVRIFFVVSHVIAKFDSTGVCFCKTNSFNRKRRSSARRRSLLQKALSSATSAVKPSQSCSKDNATPLGTSTTRLLFIFWRYVEWASNQIFWITSVQLEVLKLRHNLEICFSIRLCSRPASNHSHNIMQTFKRYIHHHENIFKSPMHS